MKDQLGFSLTELLISLFLASLILTTLTKLYLNDKHQYMNMRKLLDSRFDLLWVNDLLADSIRRAGFTPCLGLDALKTVDRRLGKGSIASLSIGSSSHPFLQINRMSENFASVLGIISPNKIILSHRPNDKRPMLIADCHHAEVHTLTSILRLKSGYLVTLTKPLHFSYPDITYVGEWLEETWFIKPNPDGVKALYYQLEQTEELSPLIHSLDIKQGYVNGKRLLEVRLGLDEDKTHALIVAVRGS